MKQLVRLLFLSLWLAVPLGVTAQQPFINQDPFAPIQRYLARSVMMSNLVLENMAIQADNGTPVDNSGAYLPLITGPTWRSSPMRYDGGPCAPPAATSTSLSCLGYCSYPYCSTKYWEQIDMLVDLNVSFVGGVAGLWGNSDWFLPDNPVGYLTAIAQTVNDINAAYDRASLRLGRPWR